MDLNTTRDIVKKYIVSDKKHSAYDLTVRKYNELRVHADGDYPFDKIDERRPFEAKEIKAYRQRIYEPITRDPVLRVMASLTKIRRSVDWNIDYVNNSYPAAVSESENLYSYCHKLPIGFSIEDWLFTYLFKDYILDANAIVLIRPVKFEISENEYLKPIPEIYNSNDVIQFIPGVLFVAKRKSNNLDGSVGSDNVNKEYVVVTDSIIGFWRKSNKGAVLLSQYEHGLGELPAFKVGGLFFKENKGVTVYESRLAPMVPRLNDAAREYSDLQAEVVQHIHSEKWVWASEKCPKCLDSNGFNVGFITDNSGKKIVCPTCNGNLKVASSPFLNMVIRPTNENIGETPAPLPPAGYITKPTDIVNIQDSRIDKHLYKALAAVNFQFIDQMPLNTSGYAKEVDRDELNNFVYGIASDLVRILRLTFNIMIGYRYKLVIPNSRDRHNIIPIVNVPQKFDLLGGSYLTSEIDRLKKSGVNPVIIGEVEREFAAKKFNGNSLKDRIVNDAIELDPLPGVSEEDKMIRLSNGGITRLDYIISSNITKFVRRAYNEYPSFYTLPISEKMKKVNLYALEVESSINSGKINIDTKEQ